VVPTDARPLQFFLSQAVAVTFEAVLILATRCGLRIAKRFQKFLGYLWVYCWFVYSIGPLMDTMAAIGVSDYGGMKFSLIFGPLPRRVGSRQLISRLVHATFMSR
jgi:hypothetical protein